MLVLASHTGHETVLDGKKRLEEHRKRGLKSNVPKLRAFTPLEAVKQLVLASHHKRAAEIVDKYLPEYRENTISSWAALTGLHRNKFQPLIACFRKPVRRGRSMQVVKNLRRLVIRAREGEEITERMLVEALGRFAE